MGKSDCFDLRKYFSSLIELPDDKTVKIKESTSYFKNYKRWRNAEIIAAEGRSRERLTKGEAKLRNKSLHQPQNECQRPQWIFMSILVNVLLGNYGRHSGPKHKRKGTKGWSASGHPTRLERTAKPRAKDSLAMAYEILILIYLIARCALSSFIITADSDPPKN